MQERGNNTRGEIASKISRESVQILRDFTGRGPTKAKTVMNGDLLVIQFADTLTKGEAKLVDLGESEHVLLTRRQFQRAMRDDLVGLVETASGRTVIAFMSDNHIDPDIAVEVFVLQSENGVPAD